MYEIEKVGLMRAATWDMRDPHFIRISPEDIGARPIVDVGGVKMLVMLCDEHYDSDYNPEKAPYYLARKRDHAAERVRMRERARPETLARVSPQATARREEYLARDRALVAEYEADPKYEVSRVYQDCREWFIANAVWIGA